ncbi:dephospho-CoA kinase [Flavobacterium sp.]|jgi:dephospho-CoA kinase|uniref:dephospho-CoA kinase n=1 Tax=Flavobacterium sp. TaxID=239 RepID=UPI0037BF3F98
MTKIIGLTGGIGSGKTMIAKYMKSLGIPVYIADDEAKKIMKSNEVLNEIRKEFGNTIFDEEKLNNVKLAQFVFNNSAKLEKLNAIVHPLVKKHFDKWLLKHKNSPLIVKEAAILFESGSYKYCDFIITVTAPIETRIQRVLERDKTDRESILKRIQNQWTDEERVLKSDFVIQNSTIKDTENQVDEILKKLNNL